MLAWAAVIDVRHVHLCAGVTQLPGVKQLVRGMCQLEKVMAGAGQLGSRVCYVCTEMYKYNAMHDQDHLDEQPGNMWLNVS